MGKTMAEVLREAGRKEGAQAEAVRARRETLLRQLEQRFGTLPPEVRATITGCKSVPQLIGWLDRVLDAKTLEDVGIPATT